MKKSILHIGFDDTDSRKGMCTTFLAYKIVEHLRKKRVQFVDYPYLIRFNPNIPWKTRGNGAVALKVKTAKPEIVKKSVISFVKRYSAIGEGANPGLVFYENERIPENFSRFGRRALHSLVNRKEARKFAAQNKIETFYMGNGQGLVGAIGAMGYSFDDHTFELISYRSRPNLGKKRIIFQDSVRRMQRETFPRTFNSYDDAKRRILIAPHGPDPVLFGVRGEDVGSVVRGASLVRSGERPSGYMVFRSNQGTGSHLQNDLDIGDLRPYSSGCVVGTVSGKPEAIPGGHVMFSISKSGHEARCAVYKPTGLGGVAAQLVSGDVIKVGGGVRRASKTHGRTINVEFISVVKLAKSTRLENPVCSRCGKHMKSKGREQGFRCIRCGTVSPAKLEKAVDRKIREMLYLPVPSAHRHLTRPLQRINKANTRLEFDESAKWFSNLKGQ